MTVSKKAKIAGVSIFGLLILAGLFVFNPFKKSPKFTEEEGQTKMLNHLDDIYKSMDTYINPYSSSLRILHFDSLIAKTTDPTEQLNFAFQRANSSLEMGDEVSAINYLDRIAKIVETVPQSKVLAYQSLGVAYLRLAERTNCLMMHSGESCIMPLAGMGIHQDKEPAKKAIEAFKIALGVDPNDLDSRWLLNIAYMTIGGYPDKVPPAYLIPGLTSKTDLKLSPFKDIASELGVDKKSRSGGMICDDFDNDGYMDIIFSSWGLKESMYYFRNDHEGGFTDASDKSGITKFRGGLNICQTDYNNDGFIDIFILRGGWQGQSFTVNQPNSLIRNNGDGTFTDVTYNAGIFSEHPTQTATWNDFNNDGWLDVFIGNETTIPGDKSHPCELYMNNQDGTFTNVAKKLGVEIFEYAKGVTSGDYDNDGWPDIFISTLGEKKFLLRNKGCDGSCFGFEDVSAKSGVTASTSKTFPSWFFDYDNDGFLDIFFCNYEYDKNLSTYAAKEALQVSDDLGGKPIIYKNNGNGTFTNVTKKLGFTQPAFAMGSNFGDIDNDGYLDFYLGTGNPSYRSLIPNRMYKNVGGESFVEVTNDLRLGHLQKGHGVAFADLDNDGDQDISEKMGGAYLGDAYNNSLFMNPGQNNNNWIKIKLVGEKSNKQGIGAKIKLSITENGKKRTIYRELNSGGSFGCSPLQQMIGIGQATSIDELKIIWPSSKITQVFNNVKPNQPIKITETRNAFEIMDQKKIQFKNAYKEVIMCAPVKN